MDPLTTEERALPEVVIFDRPTDAPPVPPAAPGDFHPDWSEELLDTVRGSLMVVKVYRTFVEKRPCDSTGVPLQPAPTWLREAALFQQKLQDIRGILPCRYDEVQGAVLERRAPGVQLQVVFPPLSIGEACRIFRHTFDMAVRVLERGHRLNRRNPRNTWYHRESRTVWQTDMHDPSRGVGIAELSDPTWLRQERRELRSRILVMVTAAIYDQCRRIGLAAAEHLSGAPRAIVLDWLSEFPPRLEWLITWTNPPLRGCPAEIRDPVRRMAREEGRLIQQKLEAIHALVSEAAKEDEESRDLHRAPWLTSIEAFLREIPWETIKLPKLAQVVNGQGKSFDELSEAHRHAIAVALGHERVAEDSLSGGIGR